MSMLKPIINVYRNPPKYHLSGHMGFPGSSMVKNLPANEGDLQIWAQPPDREDPPEKEMASHSSILAWKIP